MLLASKHIVQETAPPGSSLSTVSQFLANSVTAGTLQDDPQQKQVAKYLDQLEKALHGYTNTPLVNAWHAQQKWVMERERRRKHEEARVQERASEGGGGKDEEATESIYTSSIPSKSDTAPPLPYPRFDNLPRIPRGLYLHGSVGTGKSMLMDEFYAQYVKANGNKRARREHYHAFMHGLHRRTHLLREEHLQQCQAAKSSSNPEEISMNKSVPATYSSYLQDNFNLVQRVALEMAAETDVLCLDEFQVVDIADAYLLSQLFELLLSLGTVLVTTSNQPPPDKLLSDTSIGAYEADVWTSFVALLHRHCRVHSIESEHDYRMLVDSKVEGTGATQEKGDGEISSFYFWQKNGQTDVSSTVHRILQEFGTEFNLATSTQSPMVDLPIGFGRSISVPGTAPIGWFTFEKLCCDAEWSSLEYRALARHYRVLIVTHVPLLRIPDVILVTQCEATPQELDEARRFVMLMDELYEAKTALCVSAEATNPTELFLTNKSNDDRDDFVSVQERQQHMDHVRAVNVSNLPVAIRRAVSRLTEMTSQKWWSTALSS